MLGRLRYRYRAAKYARKDRGEIAFVRQWLRPGDFAIDAGAHKGAYLYWLRRAVGRGGFVAAFEPQPLLADYLRRRTAELGWTNVRIEWKGLSAKPGERDLAVPLASSGVSHGASFEPGKSAGEQCTVVRVPVDTVDGWIAASAGGRRLRLLKADVEGHECDLFEGARDTLCKHKPTVLFECEQRHRERPMRDTFSMLEALGMTGQFFGPQGRLLPLAQFDLARHQQAGASRRHYFNNFLFRFPEGDAGDA